MTPVPGPRSGWARNAPGGSPLSGATLRRALAARDVAPALREALARRLAAPAVTLHASGREALRVAFVHCAEQSGRDEVLVPAYVCFSVPAAAVAAGLRVRLVDTDASGRIDADSLERQPLERAACLVVGNLFGIPEPIAPLRELCRPHDVRLVDDAAQALGGRSDEGPVGGRADLGVLSFGRGKPLPALGGGAVVWSEEPPELAANPDPIGQPLGAAARGLAYDLASWPPLFGALSRLPSLGIGETVYDPGFQRGAMPGEAISLAFAGLPELDAAARARSEVAHRIVSALPSNRGFRPLLPEGDRIGTHPRLALVAPDSARRDDALAKLWSRGATGMYPSTLGAIEALSPHRVGSEPCPGAEAFAERLLTLPTHRRAGQNLEELVAGLAS